MPLHPTILVFEKAEDLALGAARRIVSIIEGAVRERGTCSIALSGGETPRAVYRQLAGPGPGRGIDWSRIHVFFGDERLVPPDDPQSNFCMARNELLTKVAIPEENVNRIRGELPADDAVNDYRSRLHAFFGDKRPRFDLILLGLGGDGHTASLFPDSPDLGVERETVVAAVAPVPPERRVTLALPVINNAREILFLVSGENKASIVREVLGAGLPVKKLPAAMVKPARGNLVWLLDSGAASQLPLESQTRAEVPAGA
jgi:6-phosphogluconolactonase